MSPNTESPIENTAPWRERLNQALRKNRRDAHNRYFQLATVGLDGSPRNRTVVFRGFHSGGESLLIITDGRSQKIVELAANPTVEACWYFTHTREQFRLRGAIEVVETGHSVGQLRDEVWRSLSDAAREQFFWAASGEPVGSGEPLLVTATAPENFIVLILTPNHVDYLLLKTPQQRIVSLKTRNGWHEQAVNP